MTFANGWVGINSLASNSVPPDPVVAVGPNIVMQVVNSNYEFWTKDGLTSAGPYPLSGFIPAGNSHIGDVQILYDNMTHRWFMTVDDFTYGSVWICTSTSYDPTSSWYLLNLSIAPAGDFFDRPILGVSDYVLGVGGNVWTNAGGFVNAEWFVINKTMLENNAGYYWWTWTNAAYYAMHPVSDWTNASVGTPGTQLFVSTNSGTTPIMVGRVTGGATATQAVLTLTNYAHAALTAPPDAIQPGAGAPYVSVSLSGTQVMNAVWQNGLLWFDFDIGCTPAGDTQVRSCAEYIEFNTVSNIVLNDITKSYTGSYVFYPAIATDWFGDAAVALGYSNSTIYPSLTVMGRNYTYTANSNEFWYYIEYGQVDDSYSGCTAAPAACRYGDYFGAAADPSDPGLIWVEGEWESTGSIWSTVIESLRVSPLTIPAAFWNQTSANADVGHAMMLNFSDTNTQCASTQSRYCTTAFGWGDGSTYSDACNGYVGMWNAPNKWTNVWNVSHTYTATGNLTVGGTNSYIDTFTGAYGQGTAYQGEGGVPALPVRVHRDPTVGVPVPSTTSMDVGQTVTFATPPMFGGTTPVLRYTWSPSTANFGCALSGGGISCTPTAPGTYYVAVVVTDALGVTSPVVDSTIVTVDAAPTATLGWSASAIDVGQSSTVTASPSGGSGGNTYSWSQSSANLGCTFSNSASAVCTPVAAGAYTASLVISDSNGGSSGTLPSPSLTVDAAVSASIPAGTPTSADVGQPVTFSTTASGGSGSYTSYSWTPSSANLGCASSTIATITCTPTVAGTYTISVVVTDSNGGTATATSAGYTVYSSPTVAAPTATPASVDVGQTTSIAATVTGGLAPLVYTWSGLPTGCSGTSATVSCTPTAAGTSSVTLKVADANGATATSSALSLTVYALPTLSAPTASPNPVNVGATLTLSTTLTGGAPTDTYSWTGLPTGCSSTNAATLTCTPSTAGTFSTKVSVTDGNGGTGTSVSTSVTVSSASGSPTVTLSASPPSVTLGATTTLTGSVSGGTTPYTYTWTGLPGGCTSANLASLSCTPTATGTYSITLKVTDAHGNVGQGSATLTVTPSAGGSPSVSLAANPSSVAVNKATSLTGTVSGGTAPFTYAWTGLPPGCTSQNAATLSCTPTTAGTYTVTLTVTDSKGNTGQGSVSLTVTNPSGGNSNQTSSPGSNLLTSPLVLALLVVAIVAVAAAVLLMRRKRPSSTAPAPAPAAEPAPSTPAATPASPPPPPPPPA